MLRPTISNRTIKLRARRTSPTRPALLVGPSRLLRGDKVRDPNVNGPRDQSPECGLLVAFAVFISQRAGPQLHLVEDSTGRILCVQRNIQSSTGAPLTQLPLCNSPLLPPAACHHRRRIRSGARRRQLGARSAAVPRVETNRLRKIS